MDRISESEYAPTAKFDDYKKTSSAHATARLGPRKTKDANVHLRMEEAETDPSGWKLMGIFADRHVRICARIL